ncbi:RNA polymerase factor sigma-32 [Halovulum sp. GXIMD14794]
MNYETAGIRSVTRQAMAAEMLDAETELQLARAWRENEDEQALHRLVNAYMRLAVSMAGKYRRYGAPMPDLVQEAGVGLMKAAEKFDPDRGVRFSTYAVWWIKASIQDYVMRNWSVVRTGSTSSQKALFFNLRRVRAKFEREAGGEHIDTAELREKIAIEVGVPVRDVEMMDARLSGSDFSLNAQQAGEDGREWVETIEEDNPQAEITVERDRDLARARDWLRDAMDTLNARERMIITERKLRDDPRTLESLGDQLGLSKERIRQLEVQALKKMRRRLESQTGNAAAQLAMA